MSHPFASIFEKALKKSSPEENLVLDAAEKLREEGYPAEEIYAVLKQLHASYIHDAEREILGEAREEFKGYLDER